MKLLVPRLNVSQSNTLGMDRGGKKIKQSARTCKIASLTPLFRGASAQICLACLCLFSSPPSVEINKAPVPLALRKNGKDSEISTNPTSRSGLVRSSEIYSRPICRSRLRLPPCNLASSGPINNSQSNATTENAHFSVTGDPNAS